MIDTIGMTDIGNGRPSNQDAYLLRQKEKNGKLYLLAVVCDGMGGLKKGEIASHYIVEVLKQNQNAPVPVEKQVAILYAVTKGILSKVAAEDVRAYEDGLYTWLDTDAEGAAVMQEISATGKLEADTEEKLKSALESYTENFINTRPAK
jgi:serine/threonine protein phosphatase PrpC